MRVRPLLVALAAYAVGAMLTVSSQATQAWLSYADVAPVFDTLRPELVPTDLRGLTSAAREAAWPAWVQRRDAEVRTRVGQGDADSVVNFLFFGTSFTSRPRPTDADMAALISARQVVPPWLRARIDDLISATAAPGTNERVRFVGALLRGHDIDIATAEGRTAATRFLETQALAMSAAGAFRTRALLDAADTPLSDRLTIFRERGLSADTSIFADHGIDAALDAITKQDVLGLGSVRRVAIIGPGLDFSDKLDGYDFYPPQTIQPFAVIDSLLREGLTTSRVIQVTAFDVSPRVLGHLASARTRAQQGQSYPLVLPRNLEQAWSPALAGYWQRMGDRVAAPGPPVAVPPQAGRAQVRSIRVTPATVLAVTPRDLNVVLQHPSLDDADRFDLVIATNILLYYDVFEQSLAGISIARMLKPGGVLLTNNRIFELPSTPLMGVGFTDVDYIDVPGIGKTGDRIIWYQRMP